MGVVAWFILGAILIMGTAMASVLLYALFRMNRDWVPFAFYHRSNWRWSYEDNDSPDRSP